jgi:Tfp pilus assembly protein PilO
MALDYKNGLSRYRKYLQVVRDQPLIRAGVWTGMSLLLVIVMITMALKPTLVVIANLLGEINQDKVIVTKLDDKIVKMQQATSALDGVTPKLPILDQALPQTPDWDMWAQELSDIASQSGTQLTKISVGPVPITGNLNTAPATVLAPGVNAISFSISATGGYDQLKQMVSEIENTRRLNVLSSVQFASTKNKNGGSDLTVNISGTVAYAPVIK